MENKILLIDEPGLYLHAKAQEDIMTYFENNISNVILYTTHSPYLINTDYMYRIKLVTNNKPNKLGTKIANKYYANGDHDTVKPIITAIGYDISRNPVDLGSGLNIITEGITDRYYILAFIKLLNVPKKIHIIPSIGATQTYFFASISIGWELDYKVLLDTDAEGKKALKLFDKLYSTSDEKIQFVKNVSTNNNETIESIFSAEDEKYTWKYGKDIDKTLCALEFHKKVFNNEIKIDDLNKKTIENIERLLQELSVL